jgi:hypothetical protein
MAVGLSGVFQLDPGLRRGTCVIVYLLLSTPRRAPGREGNGQPPTLHPPFTPAR